MKKLLLITTVLLSIVLLCSCNTEKGLIENEKTTSNDLEKITGDTQSVETNDDEIQSAEEATQDKQPHEYEKLVYTNMSLDNISIENDEVIVVNIPDGFQLGGNISSTNIEMPAENIKFSFYEKTYNLTPKKGLTKNLSEVTNGKIENIDYYIYEDGDASFAFAKGTDKLIEAWVKDNRETNINKKEISIEAAESLAMGFMQKYSLATSLDEFKVTCYEKDTIRFFYQLSIGGYEVHGEQYVVGLNKNGDIYMYSDNTSGLYSEFVDKVTEADVKDAEERLYPYHMDGAYGYADPYLKVGNDGNLYLCSAYFVDEEVNGTTIAREYMFYSRVYYEE